jgi:hypothetical protein
MPRQLLQLRLNGPNYKSGALRFLSSILRMLPSRRWQRSKAKDRTNDAMVGHAAGCEDLTGDYSEQRQSECDPSGGIEMDIKVRILAVGQKRGSDRQPDGDQHCGDRERASRHNEHRGD